MRNFPKFLFSLNFLYILLIAAETAAIIFLCLYIPSFLSVAAAILIIWLVTLAAVAAAVCRAPCNEINCSLALFVVALPVAGALIYLLAGINKKPCGSLTVTDANAEDGYEAAANKYCGVGGVGYDRAVYFKSGEEYLPALFKDIERAEKYVYIEYFIVSRGKIFSHLIASLKTAKNNGAEIKIIIDGIGSAFRLGKKELKNLRALGQVKIFNKLSPVSYRLNFRDHRKIAVIDGKAAYTGGVNIADEYANITSPYGYWKDTGVAVYGAAAEVFKGMFLSVWNKCYNMKVSGDGKERCLPFYDSPSSRSGFCENAYITAISSAKQRVHIFTPYFCASEKIASALAFAAMRGVDVRVIIPHIPDKKYAFELSKISALPLAEKGVKFFCYTPGFMHAKSMVCDDMVFIGSYNLDFRSMKLNYECGILFRGKIAEKAERDFWECLRLSAPLNDEKVSSARKLMRFFLKLFAPLI